MVIQFPWWGYTLSVVFIIPLMCVSIILKLKLTKSEIKNILTYTILLSVLLHLCIGAMAYWNSEITITLTLYIPALPVIFYTLYFMAKREHVLNKKIQVVAQEINAAIQEASSSCQEIAATLLKSSNGLQEINAGTGNLSDLIDTVRKMTDSLNLLSLNARLESGRAGEHGKGFSVIAGEFGDLCTYIEKSLNGSISNADSIIRSVGSISGDMESNSSATEQLSATFEQIASSMESLVALTSRERTERGV